MSARHFVLGYLFFAFVLVPVGWAQSSGWQVLGQIKAGTKVQVVEQSLKSTSGRFVRFSETDLTLKVEDKEIVISRDRVYRVTVAGKNRKRNTLIGLGAGAAAGVALGAAIMERESGYGGAVAGTTVGFAGVGAGIAALLPAGKTVYRAETTKQAGPKTQPIKECR